MCQFRNRTEASWNSQGNAESQSEKEEKLADSDGIVFTEVILFSRCVWENSHLISFLPTDLI